MLALRDRLRAGDIWVEGSRQWRAVEDQLITPALFQAMRAAGPLPVAVPATAQAYLKERRSLLTQRMTHYILTAVLNHHRGWDKYRRDQTEKRWNPEEIATRADQITLGVMGLGNFGRDAAIKLVRNGFLVNGWNRSKKQINKVKVFFGADQFDTFLSQTDILICLLALTPQTRNILNRHTFGKLRYGAYLINVARGEHLVDEDLLDALDQNQLSGACLDVFRTEPLPPEHPFWHHPRIIVTPHIAVGDHPSLVAPQIIENYQRVIRNKNLLYEVDPRRGY